MGRGILGSVLGVYTRGLWGLWGVSWGVLWECARGCRGVYWGVYAVVCGGVLSLGQGGMEE